MVKGRNPHPTHPSALTPHPSSFVPSHRGFTLVELLVAITIFSILAALAVSAFRGTTDDDRIAAAAQQIKNALEGARSRAIHDKAPRGVRFVRDPNNPTMVTSLQYIALAPSDQSLLVDANGNGVYTDTAAGDINKVVEYFTSFDFDTNSAPARTPNCVVPIGATVATWRQFANQGLLTSGTRIELPKGEGRWYVVAGVIPLIGGATPANQIYGLRLAEPMETDPGTRNYTPSANLAYFNAGIGAAPNDEYVLDLGVAPLAGSEPTSLAKGAVIDLDASDIPDVWRPNPAQAGSTGNVDYPGDYVGHNVDILFAPNGKMLGTAATAGMFHFYLGNIEEVDKYMQANWTPNTPGSQRPITSGRSPNIPGGTSTPQKPTILVTVLSASGQVYTSEVNFKGTTPTEKLVYAKSGKETP